MQVSTVHSPFVKIYTRCKVSDKQHRKLDSYCDGYFTVTLLVSWSFVVSWAFANTRSESCCFIVLCLWTIIFIEHWPNTCAPRRNLIFFLACIVHKLWGRLVVKRYFDQFYFLPLCITSHSTTSQYICCLWSKHTCSFEIQFVNSVRFGWCPMMSSIVW